MSVSIIMLTEGDEALIEMDWLDALPLGVTLTGDVVHILPTPLTLLDQSTDIATSRSYLRVGGVKHGGLYVIMGRATLSNREIINERFSVRGWNS